MSSTARHCPPRSSQSFPHKTSGGDNRKPRPPQSSVPRLERLHSLPSRLLGCPFRKSDPLGFNIRDAYQCCQGFATVPDVVDHVCSFHDGRKDEVLRCFSNLKPGYHRDAEAWSMLYMAIFPGSHSPPSPYHCKVVEHLDYYRIQSSCLVNFANHLEETVDTQQLKLDPVDYIMDIISKFVDVTFHFATQYGLNLIEVPSIDKQDATCNLGNFVKTEAKWKGTPTGTVEAHLMDTAKGTDKQLKTEEVAVKKDPADTPVNTWKNVVGLAETNDAFESKPDGPIPEIVDLTGTESVSSEDSDMESNGEDDPTKPPAQGLGNSSVNSPGDHFQSPEDGVPDWQLREILNYTCHNVLGATFDSIANSRLLYDTLIDLAEDFVVDLTETAASCNQAAGTGGTNGGLPSQTNLNNAPSNSSARTFSSFRGRSGGENGQGGDGGAGNNRQNSSAKQSALSRGRGRDIRLPCPFRMMYPRTFNVRSHYSCSMTYFPTIGRLKDHLREYHKRQDGAEVLCTRCFAGFKSRDDLNRHTRAVPGCDPAEYDPIPGLHGEAVNLLRGRDRAGQDYQEQWKEICKIVFQNDQTIPKAEYHAVMEHFEFAEVFLRFFGELSRHLNPWVSPEEEGAVDQFGQQAAESLFDWYNLGLDNSQSWSQIADTIGSDDVRCKDFEVLTVYCIKTLQRLAENSLNTLHENDGSRGNGGRRQRRREVPPDRLPTPAPSQGPSSMPNNSPLVFPHNDGGRPQKRRRLAPVPTPTTSMQVLSPGDERLPPLHQLGTPPGPGIGSGYLRPQGLHMAASAFPGSVQIAPNAQIRTPNSLVQYPYPVHQARGPNTELLSPNVGQGEAGDEGIEHWDVTYWIQDPPDFLTKLDRQHTPGE
ncbi:hypothetical protein B0T16DRAFT_243327 [Cercophora newfieldiana]|uniref:C2H2-type domain-containing protein n=1 Tax=Cercophora newfieldiana TaxID=92897 RepID=A0AA39XUL0_9PEZI|nr:hypothetical protein B0T16DRAFT_243327 [Cercophora newfieldiana]